MTGNRVWLISGVNGLPHWVPDDPSVIASYVGRGFEVTDIPGDLNPDDEEFVAALAEWQTANEELGEQPLEEDQRPDQTATTPSGVQPEGNEN